MDFSKALKWSIALLKYKGIVFKTQHKTTFLLKFNRKLVQRLTDIF